jgi:PAS domain-containing protein
MKRICAWCSKEMPGGESKAASKNMITHGICDNCRDNVLFQMGVELEAYLDSLDVPIVLVNQGGKVVTANNRARSMLRKDLSDIEGYRGGEVFECAYARLPEGCGNTQHCSGCTIRKTVMKTHGTGKGFRKVQATLNRNTPETPEQMNLLISTERLANVVLLRIDKIEAEKEQPESSGRAFAL